MIVLGLFIFCFLCAHSSPYTLIAILGDHHIWVNEGTEQYMAVDAIYWHESYDYMTLDYDIMLMKLAHKVQVNEYVRPVALPSGCPHAGDMCTVSGWGNIYSDEGEVLLNINKTQKRSDSAVTWRKSNGTALCHMLCTPFNRTLNEKCQITRIIAVYSE